MISGDISIHMEPVARLILGEPNARLSTKREIRFGTNGSLSVDRDRGVYFDHEEDRGGGVLDLLRHKRGMSNGDALRWLREHHFEVAEPANDRRNSERPQQRRLVEVYDYWSKDGDLAFQTVRYEPKNFSQRRPDPTSPGKWVYNLKGIEPVLYQLPELIEAVAADRTVYVAEGEKAVNALAEIGVTATCSPMGAGKWRREYSELLRGADVVVLPDDDPAGRRHAEQVVAALTGIAARVRSVDLPGLPPKGDPFDWVHAGGTAEQLVELCREADSEARSSSDAERPEQPKPSSDHCEGSERLPLFPPLPPAGPYPIENLGPLLAEAAHAIARKVQAPPAIAAQSILAAASLAAQAHADVRMPFGQRRPLGLYLVTIAASGDRKSTTDNEALWPIARREDALQEMHAADYQDYLITHAAWAAEKKKIEADRKLGFDARKAALRELGPEPLPPIRPVLTSAEPTFEGLIKSWPGMPAALGIFTAEGGQFTGGHGMAQENRLRTAAGFSVLWDGKPITRVRALDGVSILRGRRLAMHLMVQPDAAATFLSDPVLRDQGLLSRILVAAPDSIAGTRLYRQATAEDAEQIRRYHARILSLLEAPWPLSLDRAQGLQPRDLSMNSEAEKRWCDFYNWVEERCIAGGDLRPIRDFAAKAAEHAARVAGVLTIVADERLSEIGVETMTCAIKLATWYLDEALRLHGANRTDPKLLQAQALLAWMREQPDRRCQLRDVLRLGPSATRTKKDAEAALETLKTHGWVEEISARPRTFRAHAEEVSNG